MGKRVVAVSDSHGAVGTLRRVAASALARGPIDVFVFLGDGIQDARELKSLLLAQNPGMEWIGVRGNNDPVRSAPEEAFFTVNGLSIFAAHGHLHRVKWGLQKLLYTAREKGAGLALYGHTHRSHLEEAQGVLLLNPGAICEAFSGRPVLADMLVEADGGVQARLVSQDGAEW